MQAAPKVDTSVYAKTHYENKQDMTTLKNDLTALQFILKLVKYKTGGEFVQFVW